tara:strand:- start:151 stop:465 length:315 start_codon:yes stop_codon:yes gene_type:complete
MAIFRNITSRAVTIGLPTGARVFVKAGEEFDFQHPRFIEKAQSDSRFEAKSTISRAEHLPEPKTLRKPSRKTNKTEKKIGLKISEKIDKALKKKRGLKGKGNKK